jgi:hypothetical protein
MPLTFSLSFFFFPGGVRRVSLTHHLGAFLIVLHEDILIRSVFIRSYTKTELRKSM